MSAKRYTQFTDRSGQGAEKLLGELELEVMRVVWERGIVTVRDVLDALAEIRPLAYTTVMTVMTRLADKGLLAVDKKGKSYRYHAVQTREEFEAQAVGQVVQSLISDFGGEVAISQFIEKLSAVDPDQLARLAEMVRLAQEEQDER
ncbi:MAG TPA: BlaI/MecI/CopY family transcriptional regulator [Anaerolineae bacterium]